MIYFRAVPLKKRGGGIPQNRRPHPFFMEQPLVSVRVSFNFGAVISLEKLDPTLIFEYSFL